MYFPEIDLPKLAGVAGSAVGIIIATAILLSWITARYVPAFDQYRKLTQDFRSHGDRNTRRAALGEQVDDYRRRLRHLNRASLLLCWVMVLAVATVIVASLSIVYPDHKAVGAVTLFAALLLDIAAVGCVIAENRIDRRAIETEARDPDESEAAARRAA